MATIPATRTWAVGEIVTAARLNLELRDALDFLLNPPACHVSDGTGVSLVNSTATLMAWDSEQFDTDGMHSTVTNNSRITFVTAGTYCVKINLSVPGATYTVFTINARLNSAGSSSGGTSLRSESYDDHSMQNVGTWVWERAFAANDYIEFFVTQTSGANRTTDAFTLGTYAEARFVSI
jgi:hypothetical protein